ncbi:hypothetical protein BS17DRAFT_726037 [Gyrodon lividus]|nr:hypothetical protein BS17DRAFT_726037 [Gyrodon lividus]
MALDYLKIERVFSQGRQLLHFTRNRLSARFVRVFICLGSWVRHDMIPLDVLVVVVWPKKRKHSYITTTYLCYPVHVPVDSLDSEI